MLKRSLLLSLTLAGLLQAGCAKEEAQSSGGDSSSAATRPAATNPSTQPRTVSMDIDAEHFHLEIAANDHDRELGLMYRDSMPRDHGMIFVFGSEKEREFWMKNTFIPLDIVYVSALGRVVSIKHGVPLQEDPTVPSVFPMKWAIELNYGVSSAIGLKVGDKLTIPPEAPQAEDN